MTAHPDSAYRLLDSIRDEARTSWRRADRMRYELTLAEAMNKAYKDFTTDSALKQVVRYYDRRGSHNDQLKARYLLGCAYRDMDEAPAAINAWQEAVDCADTTSTDCDYNTLYRVYGGNVSQKAYIVLILLQVVQILLLRKSPVTLNIPPSCNWILHKRIPAVLRLTGQQ